MDADVALRAVRPTDGPALAALSAQSPDSGRVTFAPHYHLDAYQAVLALHSDTTGVVAEAAGFDGLVGAGLVKFGRCSFEGRDCPYALLNALQVHPAYRRRGIARRLAAWRIEEVRRRFGEDAVFLANIQAGNAGSEANAKKWASHFSEPLVAIPFKTRAAPPGQGSGPEVRPARPGELEEVAEKANAFYKEYNFARPHSAEELAEWTARTPFDSPFRHYLVAVDRAGNVLAGMALAEAYRLRTLVVKRMPASIRLLNAVLRVVPPDGTLREIVVDRPWYAPGQLEAGRFLWETVRWEWRDRGNALIVTLDPRSPLRALFNPRPWTPSTSMRVAVRGPAPLSAVRLICPM